MFSTRTVGRAARAVTIFAAAALVVGAAVPAFASDPTGEAKPARTEVSEKTRYCVFTESTGSIVKKRECRTRADWIARTGFDPLAKK